MLELLPSVPATPFLEHTLDFGFKSADALGDHPDPIQLQGIHRNTP